MLLLCFSELEETCSLKTCLLETKLNQLGVLFLCFSDLEETCCLRDILGIKLKNWCVVYVFWPRRDLLSKRQVGTQLSDLEETYLLGIQLKQLGVLFLCLSDLEETYLLGTNLKQLGVLLFLCFSDLERDLPAWNQIEQPGVLLFLCFSGLENKNPPCAEVVVLDSSFWL